MMAWPTGGARAPTDATLLIGDGTDLPSHGPRRNTDSTKQPRPRHQPSDCRNDGCGLLGNEVYVGGDDLVAVYNASQRRWTGATTIFGVPSAMAATATDLWVATEEDGLYRIPHQPEPLNNSRAARTHGGTPLWAWPLTRKTWC